MHARSVTLESALRHDVCASPVVLVPLMLRLQAGAHLLHGGRRAATVKIHPCNDVADGPAGLPPLYATVLATLSTATQWCLMKAKRP